MNQHIHSMSNYHKFIMKPSKIPFIKIKTYYDLSRRRTTLNLYLSQ